MSDDDWVMFDRDILKQYGGQVVVYRDRHIWGAGPDLDSALAAARAQEGCPETKRLRIAIVPDEDLPFYPFPPIPKPIRKSSKGSPS